MTRRSICSRTALAALAVVVFAVIPPAARADDRDAFERGRTAGRGVLIVRDPRACGIALLTTRCKLAVDAFLQRHGQADADYKSVPRIGPHPATGLRAFLAGDREAMDFALDWFNTAQSTEPMWTADGRAAAVYDAGVLDVLLPAARGYPPFESIAIAGPVADLANHAALIPTGTLPLDLSPIRAAANADTTPFKIGETVYERRVRLPAGASKFAHDLVAKLEAAMPSPPFATLSYTDDAAGDAALGVAAATVRELGEIPGYWLVQPDVQGFIDLYVGRLRAVAPEHARDAADLRVKLRGAASVDFAEMQAAHTRLLGVVFGAPTARAQRAAVAFAAAQIPYNAMIVRDEKSAATLLGVVGRSDDLDAIPGFASARAETRSLAPADWTAQYKLGLRLVDLLTKGGPN